VAILGDEELQGWYRSAPLAPRLEHLQQAWYYWARLAHVRVVAQIAPATIPHAALEFERSSDAEKANLYHKLSDLGVSAIVYNPSNDFDPLESGMRAQAEDFRKSQEKVIRLPKGWQEIEHWHCYVYFLNQIH
jgi:hypothetical protein